MIEINKILENKELVIKNLTKRNLYLDEEINLIYDNEIKRKNLQIDIENKRHQLNLLTKDKKIEECIKLKAEIKPLEDEFVNIVKINWCIFETYQNDGNIIVPEVLIPFFGKGF